VDFLNSDCVGANPSLESSTPSLNNQSPTEALRVRKPMLFAVSPQSGYLFSYRGDVQGLSGLCASVALENLLIRNLNSGITGPLVFGLYNGTVGGTPVMHFPDGGATGNVVIGPYSGPSGYTQGATLEVYGGIRAGTTNATSGSIIIASRYNSDGSAFPVTLNVFGSQHLTGNSVIGYGVRPDTASTGFLSTTTANIPRGAILIGGSGSTATVSFLGATMQTTAVGGAVPLTEFFTANTSGATFAGTSDHSGVARFASGVTFAGTSDHSGVARFAVGVTFAGTSDHTGEARFSGGVTAARIYGSGGSTFAGTLHVAGGVTFAGTSDHTGVARFAAGVTMNSSLSVSNNLNVDSGTLFVDAANDRVGIGTSSPGTSLDVSGVARFAVGVTFAGTSDHTGEARFSGGVTAARIYGSGGSTFAGTLHVVGGVTFAGTSDHTGVARFSGGVTASQIYGSGGSTFAGILHVVGGVTFAGTSDHTGVARFASGVTFAGTSDHTGEARFSGGVTAARIYGSGGSTFAGILHVVGGVTFAGTSDHSGVARFAVGVTFAGTSDHSGVARFSGGISASGGVTFANNISVNGLRVGRGAGNISTNTAVGGGALLNNTTGGQNSAVGLDALKNNTIGQYNTAMGVNTMLNNTEGENNTAVGLQALANNTTADNNTAVGVNTLMNNTTGEKNTAIGMFAMQNGTTGEKNAALGYYALASNTIGNSNTAVGVNAMYEKTTGDDNVAIGGNAGRYQAVGSAGLTTTSNSIYIGANARGFNNSDNNTIVIGANAVADGANTTVIGNSSTTSTRVFGTLSTNGGISAAGGVTAARIYGSGGSTFAGTLHVVGGVTFAGTSDHTGVARFSGGVTASQIYGSGGSTFAGILHVVGGVTFAGTSDHTGVARFAAGVTFIDTVTIHNSAPSSGSPRLRVQGNVGALPTNSTSTVFISATGPASGLADTHNALELRNGNQTSGSEVAARLTVYNGTSGLSIIQASALNGQGNALPNPGGWSVGGYDAIIRTGQSNSKLHFAGGSNKPPHVTIDKDGQVGIGTSSPGSSLDVRGNVNIGIGLPNAILGVSGSISLHRQSGVLFHDSDNSNYVGFKAPAVINDNRIWTLPAADGTNGQVLSTNGSLTLSWKNADGVTGTNKQIQYNEGGTLGATASFVFEYTQSPGFSAGTVGVSGGMYSLGNVGVGITPGAISSRIYSNSTAKLEVRGDIRIPSNGFFVNKGMTLPNAVETIISADENAFIAGTLNVPSGATLTINTNGRLIVM